MKTSLLRPIVRPLIIAAVFASAGIVMAEEHHASPAAEPAAVHAPLTPADAPVTGASVAAAHAAIAAQLPVVKSISPTSDEALETLRDGNRRFTSGDSIHPRADQDRRSETYSDGQHPIAAILSCADSRVPPELIYDAGIGDLFVIRVAGNVADTDEIATIEYGAGHLHTPLIVVMGHTKCGAVAAVVDGAELHGNLAELVDNIRPAAGRVRSDNPGLKGQSLINKVVRANVMQSIEDLIGRSEEVRKLVDQKKVKIVGAVYDINSGFIDWLGEHPRQAELMSAPLPAKPANHATAEPHDKTEPIESDPHSKPAAGKKPHESATTAHENHSAVKPAANPHAPEVATAPTKSPFKTYVPMGAFAIGSLALSAVVLHLIRK